MGVHFGALGKEQKSELFLSAEDSLMIYKGKRQHGKKMGSAFSKQKQKKEGLMSQMKSKTELSSQAPSPAPVSPSQSFCQTPPPRNLATTLSSNQLSQEFLAFLTTLDKASCLDEDECGRADSLRFVLDNQELWKECAGIVSKKILTKVDRVMLNKAASACCNELEHDHVIFLSQRKEPS